MNSWSQNYSTGSAYSNPEAHNGMIPDSVNKELPNQKRYRSYYTTSQINYMEGVFKNHAFVDKPKREHMSQLLNLPEKKIKIWFQNRRMKEKLAREENNFIIAEAEQKTPVPTFKGNPVLPTRISNSSLPKPLEAPLEIPKKPNAHSKIFKGRVTEQGTPIRVKYPIYDFKQKSKTKEFQIKDNAEALKFNAKYSTCDSIKQNKSNEVDIKGNTNALQSTVTHSTCNFKQKNKSPDIDSKDFANNDTQNQFRPNFYKDILIDENESSFYVKAQSHLASVSKDSKSDYKASAEFSIDLCKKYKEMFKNTKSETNDKLEKNNNETPPHPQSFSVIQHVQPEIQDMPQDLSIKKKPSNYQEKAISLAHTPGNTSAVGPLFVDVNQTYCSPRGVDDSVLKSSPSYNLLAIDRSAQFRNPYDTNNKYSGEYNAYCKQHFRPGQTVAVKQATPAKNIAATSSFVPVQSMQHAFSSQPIFPTQHTAVHSAPVSPTYQVGFGYHNNIGSSQYVSSLQNINSAHFVNPVQRTTSVEYMSSAQCTMKPQHALTIQHSPSDEGNPYPYNLNWHRI